MFGGVVATLTLNEHDFCEIDSRLNWLCSDILCVWIIFNFFCNLELIVSKCEFIVQCFLVWITLFRKLVSTCNAVLETCTRSLFWICCHQID